MKTQVTPVTKPCSGYDTHPTPPHRFVAVGTTQWGGRMGTSWFCERCGCRWHDASGERAAVHCTGSREWVAAHPEDDGRCTGVVETKKGRRVMAAVVYKIGQPVRVLYPNGEVFSDEAEVLSLRERDDGSSDLSVPFDCIAVYVPPGHGVGCGGRYNIPVGRVVSRTEGKSR